MKVQKKKTRFDPLEEDGAVASNGRLQPRNCQEPECQMKKQCPHIHQIDECVEHAFCPVERPETERSVENHCASPLPVPLDNPEQYLEVLRQHKNAVKPGDLGMRLIMTEYELDRWYGYQVGIDIASFPPYRPPEVNKQAYEYLKKYANFAQEENKEAGQGGLDGRTRKIRKKDSNKKKDQDVLPDAVQTGTRGRGDAKDEYKVMVYPTTKRVDSVIEKFISQDPQLSSKLQDQPSYQHSYADDQATLDPHCNAQVENEKPPANLNKIQKSIIQYMKTLVNKNDQDETQDKIKTKKVIKHEYLKGKSVIYQQENFEKHEPLTKEITDRLNDNITDKLSRREIFEAVRKFKQVNNGNQRQKSQSAFQMMEKGFEKRQQSNFSQMGQRQSYQKPQVGHLFNQTQSYLVHSYTEKPVGERPQSQGAVMKKRKIANTLRAALSVQEEGVVKSIAREFQHALDTSQRRVNKSDLNNTTQVSIHQTSRGMMDMKFKRFANSTTPFQIFGVKAPKSQIQMIRDRDFKERDTNAPSTHPIIDKIHQAALYPSSSNQLGFSADVRKACIRPASSYHSSHRRVISGLGTVLQTPMNKELQEELLTSEPNAKVLQTTQGDIQKGVDISEALNSTALSNPLSFSGPVNLVSPFSPLSALTQINSKQPMRARHHLDNQNQSIASNNLGGAASITSQQSLIFSKGPVLATQVTTATNGSGVRRREVIHMVENEEKEALRPENQERCQLAVVQIVPSERTKVREQAFQDAEFWFIKGYSMQKEGGVEVAQDYYLQGIRCNPNHFPCVYNLACVYSRLENQCNARKWFNHATKINPNILDSYYGSALSSFKLKQFQEAFNTLKSIPANAETQSVRQEELIYFRSQCMKKVGLFHDAEREYKSLMNQFQLTEGHLLKKYVFGLMLLPLQRERKVIEDYVDNFYELVKLYSPDQGIDRVLQHNLRQVYYSPIALANQLKLNPVVGGGDSGQESQESHQPVKWHHSDYAVQVLNQQPFLRRVGDQAIRDNLKHMRLVEKRLNDNIFPDTKIILLLNGRIILRRHERNPLQSKTLASYTKGQILGYNEADEGICEDSDVWVSVASKFVQYLEIDRPCFLKLWKLSQNPQDMVTLCVFQQFEFSQRLFQLTLSNIIYEYGKRVKFQKGEVLMPLHRRSIFQSNYKEMYEAKQSKLLEEVERQMSQPTRVRDGKKVPVTGTVTMYGGLMAAVCSSPSDRMDQDDASHKGKNSSMDVTSLASHGENSRPQAHQAVAPSLGSSARKRHPGQPEENEKQFEDPPHTPIIIILDGKCSVVNPLDGYVVASLNKGDVVGDSDFLKYTGYEFFGDVLADSPDGVDCIMIEHPEIFISFLELQRVQFLQNKRLEGLKYTLSRKYGKDLNLFHKY